MQDANDSNKKTGCGCGTVLVIIVIVYAIFQVFSGPKIEGDTAYVKMDLYYHGTVATEKEWAEHIWEAVQNEEVEHVIAKVKVEYIDEYGKSEEYKREIELTSLISPLSEARKYSKDKFVDEFYNYIADWVSEEMYVRVHS